MESFHKTDFGELYQGYEMKIRREWAMPSHETFNIPPIKAFVEYYLRHSKISIDPFARNFTGAIYTNDINKDTLAKYHLDALDFLKLMRLENIKADLVIFDPPYSLRQIKECYNGFGRELTLEETQNTNWKKERNIIDDILSLNGVVLNFGWNSIGMGITRGYAIEEILLVCHGRAHNDTICMAERKTSEQLSLF